MYGKLTLRFRVLVDGLEKAYNIDSTEEIRFFANDLEKSFKDQAIDEIASITSKQTRNGWLQDKLVISATPLTVTYETDNKWFIFDYIKNKLV